MVNLTVNRFYIQTVQSGPSTKTAEEKSINGIVMNLKFLKLILIHIFHCNFNQLEKLEAAKAAGLVCLSLLSLTGSFLALLGLS